MFVVLVGSVLTTLVLARDVAAGRARSASRYRSRSGSGSPCCSRTSPKRWPRGAGRPRPTRCASRARRRLRSGSTTPTIASPWSRSRRTAAAGGHRALHAGRHHSRRRGGDRRGGIGGRVGDHRRVGSGNSRVGWRPLGGDGRHQGALRLSRHPHQRQPRRDVHRSNDRPRRRRAATEDAERDRAHDFAVGADDHLPAGRRDAAAVRHLLRRRGRDPGADLTPRLSHSDDDRRPPLGDRHRRHGSHDPAERHCDERAGSRGGGRREHAAAGQDRHDHARQPTGGGVHPDARRHCGRVGRPSAARLPSRRDARGTEHRGAGQGAVRAARPHAGRGDACGDCRDRVGRERGRRAAHGIRSLFSIHAA